MAKSKTYLSFVILFAFLLSSHVLANDLRETSPEKQHLYDEGNDFKHSNEASLQDLVRVGIVTEAGAKLDVWVPPPPTLPPDMYRLSSFTSGSPHIKFIGKSTRPYNAEVDGLQEPKMYWTFPRASRKTMPRSGRGHYSHSATYNPSNSEVTEPQSYVNASVMKHPSIVRQPSEIDWSAFRAFQARTFGRKNSGQNGYGGVPRMEDVGEETKN